MNDDRLDELLSRGTRDYNEPGAAPREEMWARISAARAAAAAPAAVVIPLRTRRTRVWAGAAVAAGLILAAGIAIGRRLEHSPAPQTSLAKSPGIVRRDSADSIGSQTNTPATGSPTTVVSGTKLTAPDDEIVRTLRAQTRNTGRRAEELAQAASTAGDNQSNNLAYHLVVLQHLAGSEAMITAFRSSAQRGDVDREIAAWSRELLSTTRMLETSNAAAQDPTMRRLLEDLDLVIAQITQYVTRGTNNPDDLDLIEQSISKRSVIAKLRGTISGRNQPAGT
ncbi:MAG: hypothetical protein ABJF01_09665 [bacterium]